MSGFAEILKKHGLKATFQRMTILSFVHDKGHASVDEIYGGVLRSHPTLSLATVYKNIIAMVEKGVLVEVPIAGRKSKYELKKEDHLHLVCTICGDVKDIEMDDLIGSDTMKVAKDASFDLRRRQINLYGVCGACGNSEVS